MVAGASFHSSEWRPNKNKYVTGEEPTERAM